MQTAIDGKRGKDISRSHSGRSGGEAFGRRKEQTQNHSRPKVCRSGFLKQQLPIIPAKQDEDSLLNEYLSEENFVYLSECAVHYAGLLGKSIELPTGTAHEKISFLFHRFEAILPDKQRLNIELSGDQLRWIIYRYHRWNDHTFYWMPVKFITALSGQIRETAMSFMHLLIRKNGFNRFKNGYEFDYLFDYLNEIIRDDDCHDTEKHTVFKLLESYENGEISVFLDEVYNYKPVDVIRALEEYRPANPQEAKLLDCLRKGVPFISGKNCIMNYDYNPYYKSMSDYDDEYQTVTLDRIIRYVYCTSDFVSSELENILNQEMQESYAAEPVSFHILNHDSELFITDNYPERFSEWFLETVNVIGKITE